ncbi:GIY-YIG nuclease family protein [Candidatus Uhrbacteria bacterium]|nr:GIY-YIG nuclease family protein [Candidatus Uhrbacteria bacterium]
MHLVYILVSIPTGRWYIGMTHNIDARLKEHNSGNVRSTKGYRPYKVVHIETYNTVTEARKREIQIKKSGIIRKELKAKIAQNTAPSSNG